MQTLVGVLMVLTALGGMITSMDVPRSDRVTFFGLMFIILLFFWGGLVIALLGLIGVEIGLV